MSEENKDQVPQIGTPEYDTYMANKADSTMNPPEDRPSWLPEKFNTPEDMAKAYAELESKQGSQEKPKEPEAKPEAEQKKPEGEQKTEEQKTAEEAVEKAGLNFQDLSNEYNEKGQLSEESYEKLIKGGIPREYVDAYIEGQKAVSAQATQQVYGLVGGEEAYGQMLAWASTNLTEGEIKAYNKATEGDSETLKLAVQGLHGRYLQANGSDPKLLSGGTSPGKAAQGYNSRAEMTADINSPKYQKDPHFRRQVEAKIAATDFS